MVVDTSNNACHSQVHWLVATPYLAIKASNVHYLTRNESLFICECSLSAGTSLIGDEQWQVQDFSEMGTSILCEGNQCTILPNFPEKWICQWWRHLNVNYYNQINLNFLNSLLVGEFRLWFLNQIWLGIIFYFKFCNTNLHNIARSDRITLKRKPRISYSHDTTTRKFSNDIGTMWREGDPQKISFTSLHWEMAVLEFNLK